MLGWRNWALHESSHALHQQITSTPYSHRARRISCSGRKRKATKKGPQRAAGPVVAVVLTLQRLGWLAVSGFLWRSCDDCLRQIRMFDARGDQDQFVESFRHEGLPAVHAWLLVAFLFRMACGRSFFRGLAKGKGSKDWSMRRRCFLDFHSSRRAVGAAPAVPCGQSGRQAVPGLQTRSGYHMP